MEDNQALANSDDKTAQAHDLVKRHSLYAAGVGLVPIPFVGTLANTGVQLKMLKTLSEHYGVEFTEDLGKKLVAALVGGVAPSLAQGTVMSLLKQVPVIGGLAAIATGPLVNSATTYAVGKVFIQHFESGGTFLDFDPATFKAYFAEQYEKGKSLVSDSEKKARGKQPATSTP
jgi:uncharacterized protein (DUF697 family)